LYDPVFEIEGIDSASVDRFWLRVVAGHADEDERIDRDLAATEPLRIVSARRRLP